MTDLTLFGLPPSTYVRTAQLSLEMKGVAYKLEMPDFRSTEYRQVHPFGKIPALQHGAVTIFETLAIAVYIDEAFDGPALQPKGAAARAEMFQWISATNDYFYKAIVGGLVAERFVKPMRGMEPDEANISAHLPVIEQHMSVLNARLSEAPYLAGDDVSLADFFVVPIMAYVDQTPEASMFDGKDALRGWLDKMSDCPGYGTINPALKAA